MVYLDYAANTPVDKEVLDKFYDTLLNNYGNPNSTHQMGVDAKELIDSATAKIASLLGATSEEIIYTSGATEANNLALRGVCERYKDRGKHILLSTLEHSSLMASAAVMQEQGFEVELIPVDEQGLINVQELKNMIRPDTIFVSVVSVDSELGLVQPIEEIGRLLKEYPNIIFHTDASQSVGKVSIDFSNVDLVTVSPHKFYGINDLGILIKRKEIGLKPIIFGGRSTTVFRSGTPNTASIVSASLALEKATINLQNRYNYVKQLNKVLVQFLKSYPQVHVNNNENSIPYVINFSVKGVTSHRVVDLLNQKGIYLSSKTSCCPVGAPSKLVYAMTRDNSLAASSIRLSLSFLTTPEELEEFGNTFDEVLEEIMNV